ncbi:putative branched-chain-amino-acid aminotransferase [Saccharata proteae CBS 121410]|uniref:Branched-chain-amino-acid aminotransferase n=1 Tax=Saccharata proteae CBS 121410 TaxID=1314787 RepID=A0A9P4LVP0_9PEZI|nr:putative branched-chain-amino-acid aminotransferase [Saccharata proteae CBS 121410]
MSPSAVPPSTTSGLTNAGVEATLQTTAPSESHNSKNNSTTASPLAELDASKLTATYTTSPRTPPAPNSPEVYAQKTCTDHMITVSWTATHGWAAPELKPYGPLSLMPTASVLHYATECFEGQKLYRGHDGRLRLFRPDCNAARMLVSASRIALPGFAPAELQKLVAKLCAVDGPKWLPNEAAGNFLYIRPTMIGNDEALGIQQPKQALLYIIMACFPNLDVSVPTSPAAVAAPGLKLLASSDDMVRAWPGGFGYAKVGANYGPSLLAQGEARREGFDQILWLFGEQCNVTEAGGSNFFVVWREKGSGRLQLVTAPLTDGIILDGVTRRSVLVLARERLPSGWKPDGDDEDALEPIEVVERKFTMFELMEASEEGRLVEAFSAGTAFFIAPVSRIHFRGKEVSVPLATGDSGRYARVIKTWLRNIQYGKEKHEWGVVLEEEGA